MAQSLLHSQPFWGVNVDQTPNERLRCGTKTKKTKPLSVRTTLDHRGKTNLHHSRFSILPRGRWPAQHEFDQIASFYRHQKMAMNLQKKKGRNSYFWLESLEKNFWERWWLPANLNPQEQWKNSQRKVRKEIFNESNDHKGRVLTLRRESPQDSNNQLPCCNSTGTTPVQRNNNDQLGRKHKKSTRNQQERDLRRNVIWRSTQSLHEGVISCEQASQANVNLRKRGIKKRDQPTILASPKSVIFTMGSSPFVSISRFSGWLR